MNDVTNQTDTTSTNPRTVTSPPKTALITLHAHGWTLTLLATRKADGRVVTTVTTKDAKKKTTRGMTVTHVDMVTAKAHLATLAEKAHTLGWSRRTGFVARPDAFSKLPTPPKEHLDTKKSPSGART